jgi:hypothetical protein
VRICQQAVESRLPKFSPAPYSGTIRDGAAAADAGLRTARLVRDGGLAIVLSASHLADKSYGGWRPPRAEREKGRSLAPLACNNNRTIVLESQEGKGGSSCCKFLLAAVENFHP